MKSVSRFEANLLRLLHCFLGRLPVEQALPSVLHSSAQPRCLSRAAVGLVHDALAKGCVAWLARVGGWRRTRHLRGERAVEGRLWERTPPSDLALRFSHHSLEFLIWLTATRLSGPTTSWTAAAEELTPADWLLLFLAYETLRPTEAAPTLRSLPPVEGNVLCRLAYPQDFPADTALTA